MPVTWVSYFCWRASRVRSWRWLGTWGGWKYVTLSPSQESHLRRFCLSYPSVKSASKRGSVWQWRQCRMSCQWGGGRGTTWSSTWTAWGAAACSPTSPPSPPSSSPPTSWGSPASSFGTRGIRGIIKSSRSTIPRQSLGFWKGHLGAGEPLRSCLPHLRPPSQALAGFPPFDTLTWWYVYMMTCLYDDTMSHWQIDMMKWLHVQMMICWLNDTMTQWHDDKMTWWHNVRFSCFSTTTSSTYPSSTSYESAACHFQVINIHIWSIAMNDFQIMLNILIFRTQLASSTPWRRTFLCLQPTAQCR